MTNLLTDPTATTDLADDLAVDFEPCDAYRAPVEHDEPFCASCGHLADDHERDAQVTRLPRRALPQRMPARKAS